MLDCWYGHNIIGIIEGRDTSDPDALNDIAMRINEENCIHNWDKYSAYPRYGVDVKIQFMPYIDENRKQSHKVIAIFSRVQ